MKKMYLILSLLVLLFLLAACGGGGSEPAPAPAAQPTAQQPAAPAVAAGDPVKGKEHFATCAGCHGPDGKGITGLGKDMTSSEFIKSQTDEQLLAFIKVGRPATDPLNTVGVDMPPKGGNPALTDAQIMDIIAYMHSIQQ
ncbi:MAG TPA: cytochrome c [Anaerolineae bacterium]|nr:cytochrome c [Anaerolineae bacterium]